MHFWTQEASRNLAGGEAKRNHRNPYQQMIPPRRGGGQSREAALLRPCRGVWLFGVSIRWFSLAMLAPPPANLHCPFGTHGKRQAASQVLVKCMTRSRERPDARDGEG